jgi:hypothetical protein
MVDRTTWLWWYLMANSICLLGTADRMRTTLEYHIDDTLHLCLRNMWLWIALVERTSHLPTLRRLRPDLAFGWVNVLQPLASNTCT